MAGEARDLLVELLAQDRLRAGVVLLALLVARPLAAGDGTLGYDPERDPGQDLAASVQRAQARGARILVVVGGEWCSWCHVLDRFLKADEAIRELWDGHYETLKVHWDPDSPNEAFLSRYPAVAGYPHIFVLDGDGRFLHSQNTAELEEGDSYSTERMREFLTRWAPRP